MKKAKKFLLALLAVCSVACLAFVVAGCDENANEAVVESLHFQKIEGKEEYRVAGLGNVSDLDIVIPATYKGLPVTEIGDGAFAYDTMYANHNIRNVQISSNIKAIGVRAFVGCQGLTTIEIPGSVSTIGREAFSGCGSLTSVIINEGVEIIGGSVFYECGNLVNVTIPNSISSIGESAFGDCYDLQYNIKDNLKYLGNDSNPYVCLMDTTSSEIKTANIDIHCKTIGSYAFFYCESLTSIVIPNNVVYISYGAFSRCSNLQVVVLSNRITDIEGYVFEDCTNLESVVLSDNTKYYGANIFKGCEKLQYTEKEGLKYLGSSTNPYLYLAGTTTTSILTAFIDEECRIVGSNAFLNCLQLTSVVIPKNVNMICSNAFSNCVNLGELIIPINVERMDNIISYCNSVIIYCEAEQRPQGWFDKWNYYNYPVVWGYKGE